MIQHILSAPKSLGRKSVGWGEEGAGQEERLGCSSISVLPSTLEYITSRAREYNFQKMCQTRPTPIEALVRLTDSTQIWQHGFNVT